MFGFVCLFVSGICFLSLTGFCGGKRLINVVRMSFYDLYIVNKFLKPHKSHFLIP